MPGRNARYRRRHLRQQRGPANPKRRRRQLLAICAQCAYCGKRLTEATATLEHIKPLWMRPDLAKTASNHALACAECNGTQDALWRKWRREHYGEVENGSHI